MYDLEIKPGVQKTLDGLRDKKRFEILYKKTLEIQQNPLRKYKPLRAPLQGFRRVHIDSHFVLIFRIDHSRRVVELWHFSHHDEVYAKK